MASPNESTESLTNTKPPDTIGIENKEKEFTANVEKETMNENPSSSFNPNFLPDDEDPKFIDKLRGDAIGETLYSERFVISTLLKLREIKEPLEKDEKFERDLESLWDMTIEKDVVLMLVQLDVYEIFMQSILNYHNDERLVEILIGIMGNMCTVADVALENLCKNELSIDILIHLANSEDSCILIQLMRLITIIYGNDKAANIWNQRIIKSLDLVENFCFLLCNSNNITLLGHTLETLNAILAKCAVLIEVKNKNNGVPNDEKIEENAKHFLEKFAQLKLLESTIEAFQTLIVKEEINSDKLEKDDFIDPEAISESFRKSIIVFLNINDIFINHTSALPEENWEPLLEKCLLSILSRISTPIFLVHANADFLRNVLDSLGDIYAARPNLHNAENTFWAINIWQYLKNSMNSTLNEKNDFSNDFGDKYMNDELKETFTKVYCLGERLLVILLQRFPPVALERLLKRCEPSLVCNLLTHFGFNNIEYNEQNLITYSERLCTILKDIKDEN